MNQYKRYTKDNHPTKLDIIMHRRGMTCKELFYRIKESCIDLTRKTGEERFISEIPKCSISSYKSGKMKNPTLTTVLKICHALGLTPNDIIENVMDENGEW